MQQDGYCSTVYKKAEYCIHHIILVQDHCTFFNNPIVELCVIITTGCFSCQVSKVIREELDLDMTVSVSYLW